MKVKELIEKLSKYDLNIEVEIVNHMGYTGEIEGIALYRHMASDEFPEEDFLYLLEDKEVGPSHLIYPIKRLD
jgi:hypothetical protein